MRRAFLAVPIGLLLSLAALGCSPDTADLFATGGPGNGGSGGAASSSGSKTSATTSTSPPDTTANTSAVSTTGSTNPDTTVTTSGPMDTVASTNQASSSSGNPGGPTVPCGNAGNCSTDNDGVCCWDYEAKTTACTAVDDCQYTNDTFPTAIQCHLPADCGIGETCCAHKYFDNPQYWYDSTTCEFDCGNPDRVVCNPMAAVNICPTYQDQTGTHQMVCKASTLLPMGYSTCQAQ